MVPIQKQERYARLHAEVNELSGALGMVRARLASVRASLQAEMTKAQPVDGGAAHIKAALEFVATGTVQLPKPEISTLSEECAALIEQESALQKTVKDRSKALERVASELSAVARVELSPAHRELARKYVAKLEELAELEIEEDRMLAEAWKAGYDFSFSERLRNQAVGSIREVCTSALYYHYTALRSYAAKA